MQDAPPGDSLPIGAATAVGVTTENPGFIMITFLGTLALPRVLGLAPRRRWGRGGFGPRGMAWGGGCPVTVAPTRSRRTPTTQSV